MPNAVDIAVTTFGMSWSGNFEGSNILNLPQELQVVADQLGMTGAAELDAALRSIKEQLYAARAERIPPALDDKVLSSWNGMMLASLAEAARVLERADYLEAAARAGEFLLRVMIDERGRLYRTHRDGRSKLNAYLEDYANIIDALLELYQSTFDEKWFVEARRLADIALERFAADEGGFYDTSDDHERLIVRPRNLQDNVTPSGNAMMAKQLLRLAAYTGEQRYDESGRAVLKLLTDAMGQYPQAFAEALNVTDMAVSGMVEVAIVGIEDTDESSMIMKLLREEYRPNLIVAQTASDVDEHADIPLLSHRRKLGDATTVYVCRNFACRLPVTSAEDTAVALAEYA